MKSVWVLVSLVLFLPFLNVQAAPKLKDIGNSKAPKGGTFQRNLSTEPQTLNPLTSTDVPASLLHERVMDTLMVRNLETYGFEPGLATKYTLSKDEKVFTFYLRKDAKFHDGKPVTAKDVKFSFDALKDPKYNTAHILPYYENIDRAEIVNDYTVKFFVKKPYFNNFSVLAGLDVVPYHVYKDPKKKINKRVIGSGPYKLKKYQKGKSILLERNKDWWGYKDASHKHSHNFDKILMRFVKETNIGLEMLKKGKLDYETLTAEQFVKKTKGKPWGSKVLKQKVINKYPKSYGYIGWNIKNDLFKDRNVRVALAHLMNRELMNKKFRYGMSLLATGPWYRQSPYADQSVKPFKFNPKKAAALLAKAGWKDSDKDGLLDKVINGKKRKFSFTLLHVSPDMEKYLTMYKEDLKANGIRLILKKIEWNSLLKALQEKKFEAVNLGWGAGSVHNDPKQIWHSESSRSGGSNYISYKNPLVDKLIDKGRKINNMQERVKVYKKIYRTIAADAPYLFLFVNKYALYAVNKKIHVDKPTKQYDIGYEYWSIAPQ